MSDQPLRILLVEDNPGDAVLLECALRGVRRLVFKLSRVERLEEMIDRLRSESFDVLILDMDLPDSRGLDTVTRAVAHTPQTPVVVLTGRDDEEMGLEAMRRGAQEFVIKGETDKWSLVRAIRHAIERKQVQKALQKAHDELERKVQERTADLRRVNHVLQMVTACNEALVRNTDEESLLEAVCRIIVERGGYRMAWVGFPEHDEHRTIRFAASVGFEDGYLQTVRITWADEPLGRGPTGTALRTGKISIGNDFLSDPHLAPWREPAIKRGFRSSVGLPLTSGSTTLGVLTIYSDQPNAFAGQIVEMLSQLADDLAYGIVALRGAADRRRLEREVLQATEREQWRIGRDLHDSIQGNLAGAKMLLSVIEKRVREHAADLGDQINEVAHVMQHTLEQTRGLSHGLCPMDLHGPGLPRCLVELCGSMQSLFRVNCEFRHDKGLLIEDELIATQLYYIAQEAVNNAVKHSRGKHIWVALEQQDGQAVLSVIDDGTGIDKTRRTGTGLGMRTMNYRARLMGGTLDVAAGTPHGTIVRCRLGLPT